MEEQKRLTLEINETLHKEVKQRALDRNISIKLWILEAIYSKIAYEKQSE